MGQPLEHDKVAKLITLFHNDNLTFASVFFLKNARGSFSTLEERAAFTKRLLTLVNPGVNELKFSFGLRPDNKLRVDLSGNEKLKDPGSGFE